jgi:hypothetical protein
MRHPLTRLGAAGFFVVLVCASPLAAQEPAGQGNRGVQVGVPDGAAPGDGGASNQRRRPSGPPKPAPRSADGRALLGASAEAKGLWLPGPVIPNPLGLPADLPYKPWAKALRADRQTHRLEPHARCKPSGGARVFLTPYGVEIVEFPELQQVLIFDVGGPHTYRTIYTDGRTHPAMVEPSYYGHSIGWWEGDTLVVDSVGFNEGFWFDRSGLPHTEKLRTLERFTRVDLDTLRYELTIDDPGAYTAPFTGRVNLIREGETELFEYVCQQANYAHELMVGQAKSVDRRSPIVP